MGKTLLQMLADIFGKNIFSKTIGTRTNVIKLPSADKRRLFKNDLDIGRANEGQTETIKKELEEIIPDIPKMNDMEKLTLEGNVRRLYNKLFPQETSGEVIDIATKKKVTGEGLESLKEKAGIPEGVEPGSLMGRLDEAVKKLQGQKEKLDLQLKEMESPLKPSTALDPREGMVRTAAREILQKNMKAGKLKINDPYEAKMILESRQGGVDPIDVYRRYYGEVALERLDDVADDLMKTESYSQIDQILTKNELFDIPVKKNAGKYDEGVFSDAEMAEMLKDSLPDPETGIITPKSELEKKYGKEKLDEMLKPKKPTEPEEFNTGGRVGLKRGSYLYKAYKGSALEKLMTNPTVEGTVLGYEGIGSLIDILRGFGLFSKGGRVGYAYGTVSKYILGIINSIKKLKPIDAMKEMNEVVAKRGKYKNLNDDEVKKIFDDTNDHIFERDVKPLETDVNFDEAAEELAAAGAPKAAERFALKKKYPGIDERLLTNIIDDTNPDRKARVLAELDQAMELMKRDISSDEVIDILKNQSRTKQAEGGLSYLMGF